MVNRVFLRGVVSSDLDIRYFNSDYLQLRFSLETQEEIEGQDKPRVQYHYILVRGELARSVELTLDKGVEVSLEGRLSYRAETDVEGRKSVRTEIECHAVELISKPSERGGAASSDKGEAQLLETRAISELPWSTFAPEEGEDPFA